MQYQQVSVESALAHHSAAHLGIFPKLGDPLADA